MSGIIAVLLMTDALAVSMRDVASRAVLLLGTISLDPPGKYTATEVIITISLLSLLTQKELFRAYGGESASRSMRLLNIAIVPLFVLFTAFISLRLLNLLRIL